MLLNSMMLPKHDPFESTWSVSLLMMKSRKQILYGATLVVTKIPQRNIIRLPMS